MTNARGGRLHPPDGDSPYILLDRPEFTVLTWCRDAEALEPTAVFMVLQVNEDTRLLIRFFGPKVIDDLILSLTAHRNDVWPLDDLPLQRTFSEERDLRGGG